MYAADAADNLTTLRSQPTSGINADNQTADLTTNYDGNGNPLDFRQVVDNGGPPSGVLTYDVLNRLSDAQYYANNAPVNHLLATYRGDGLRASKRIVSGNSMGAPAYFLYDGTRVVCELDGAGNVSASYGYGAAGLAQTYAGTYTAYGYDPMGNVTTRVSQNSDQNVPAGSTPGYDFALYDAFGNLVTYRLPGQNVMTAYPPNDHAGYGGQWGDYTDAETGLILMGWHERKIRRRTL